MFGSHNAASPRLPGCLLAICLGAFGACDSSGNDDNGSGLFGQGGDTTAAGGSTVGTGGSTAGIGGGVTSTGGKTGLGGKTGAGGVVAAGGSVVAQDPDECLDTATFKRVLTGRFDKATIITNSSRTYGVMTNWWGNFDGQTVEVDGLSLRVNNPKGVVPPPEAPDKPNGYPALFLGAYQGFSAAGSNLPKSVDLLVKATGVAVPTVFQSNATSLDTSNFNAAYDVWFTASNAPLATDATDPGTGGAFLMVWMYKPSNRQPRGSVSAGSHAVSGVEGSWDVWIDRSNPPCISYVSTTPRSSLEFDLNNFIKDSVDNKYGVTTSMSLSVIFAGFEDWGGANGAELQRFCAKVN